MTGARFRPLSHSELWRQAICASRANWRRDALAAADADAAAISSASSLHLRRMYMQIVRAPRVFRPPRSRA